MKRIGLFGGTFDPVHKGHVMVAEIAKKEMELDEVIFIPAGNPPHKEDKKIADGTHRLNMLLLATEDMPYFKVSDIEIRKKEKSYSVDLIKHFRKELKKTELFFIIGADSLYNLPTWYHYEELMQMTNFIVISRPETNKSSLLDKFSGNEKPMRAFFVDDVFIDISSTEIREMLKSGADTEKYLDKSVLNYIRANRLY
ncbi:MAG: nicotinate-nucleotide adenylyltransferase [Ruminococcaceae bacterium]|nr:nicotinate-nucleotide adenylyltransferase [Oscillospiraceae bacterium]